MVTIAKKRTLLWLLFVGLGAGTSLLRSEQPVRAHNEGAPHMMQQTDTVTQPPVNAEDRELIIALVEHTLDAIEEESERTMKELEEKLIELQEFRQQVDALSCAYDHLLIGSEKEIGN